MTPPVATDLAFPRKNVVLRDDCGWCLGIARKREREKLYAMKVVERMRQTLIVSNYIINLKEHPLGDNSKG